MSHFRKRFLTQVLKKSVTFWPVICLIGARQVGKSTLLKKFAGYSYKTLDDEALLQITLQDPKSALNPPCVIDEAQKAPRLFNAVKLDVDREKKPGKYILTGSVRFSRKTMIRESLTGRAKTLQLYPLSSAERLSLEPIPTGWENRSSCRIARNTFERCLDRGGMPAIFAARSTAEWKAYWNVLIDGYLYRDLLFALDRTPKPALAKAILIAISEILALGELPTFSRISKKTGGSRGLAEQHIAALEDMMLLHRISYYGKPGRKDFFLPYDTGFFLNLLSLDSAKHDLAIYSSCLYIHLVNEALVYHEYQDIPFHPTYIESSGGQLVHLITQNAKRKLAFWKIFTEEVPHRYDIRSLEGAAEKFSGKGFALTAINYPEKLRHIQLLPWEWVL